MALYWCRFGDPILVVEAHFALTPHDEEFKCTRDTMTVEGGGTQEDVKFSVMLSSDLQLQERSYTLVGDAEYGKTWVVCKRTAMGFLQKVTVVTMVDGLRPVGSYNQNEYYYFV